ncbi:MAG: YeeE/YedE family protein [Spirochaetaceae bacterium]|nr:MAG: YeeE/YedE family protein [Spirochaetaceae bacterium]
MWKKLSDALGRNEYYLLWLKDAWPYLTGALLLSILQIATMAVAGNPWGISGAITNWGAWTIEALGGSVEHWYYFSSESARAVLDRGILQDPVSIRNFGIIAGALFSVLIASSFKLKKIRTGKQVTAAVLGGLLMGYGMRVALGCNIGAFYSGISVLSLAGWVYGVFLLLGAIVGGKLLVRFFM